MVALAIDRGPAAGLPMRYLRLIPLWGVLASLLLLFHGPDLFVSRWASSTIAIVHVFTLGVLGNAMLGSLLQFLPVVTGAEPVLASRLNRVLPVLFNVSVLALVATMQFSASLLPTAASGVLLSVVLYVWALLRSMRNAQRRTLTTGIALALGGLMVTAGLGGSLALGWAGYVSISMFLLTDIHAAIALIGTALLLLGAVGSVVVPMFQGTRPVTPRAVRAWMTLLFVSLVSALLLRALAGGDAGEMALLLALPVAAFALGLLWLQQRAARQRNAALRGFWRLGATSLLLCVVVIAVNAWLPAPRLVLVAGTAALGIALPALILGMLLQIAGFLGWLQLQPLRSDAARAAGVRVPGIERLFSEQRKLRALGLHSVAGIALLCCAVWPHWIGTGAAGLLMALAYGDTSLALWRLDQQIDRFSAELRFAHSRVHQEVIA